MPENNDVAAFEIEEAIIEWLDTPAPNPATGGNLDNDAERAALTEKILKRLRDKDLLK